MHPYIAVYESRSFTGVCTRTCTYCPRSASGLLHHSYHWSSQSDFIPNIATDPKKELVHGIIFCFGPQLSIAAPSYPALPPSC